MPVIHAAADYAAWLDEQPATTDELRAVLKPYAAENMECFKIGTKIGSPKNDDPSLIEPMQ